MKSSSLFIGVVIGIYIAQNYDLPDIKNVITQGFELIKDWESTNRKD